MEGDRRTGGGIFLYERWRRRKNIIWRKMEGKDEEKRESGG